MGKYNLKDTPSFSELLTLIVPSNRLISSFTMWSPMPRTALSVVCIFVLFGYPVETVEYFVYFVRSYYAATVGDGDKLHEFVRFVDELVGMQCDFPLQGVCLWQLDNRLNSILCRFSLSE